MKTIYFGTTTGKLNMNLDGVKYLNDKQVETKNEDSSLTDRIK